MQKKTIPMFYAGKKQSYAAAVVFGGLVFCSGMTGRLPETGRVRYLAEGIQAWDALDKVKAALEQAGTSLENIVRMEEQYVGNEGITFLKGPTIMDYFRKHAPSLAEDMPTATNTGLQNLCYPEELVNLPVIAAMPGAKGKTIPFFYGGPVDIPYATSISKPDFATKQTFASTIPVGDLIFASGHSGRLPETGRVRNGVASVQAVDALDKIKPALEQAGTALDNIVRIDYWFVGNEGVTLWEGAIMDYLQKHAPSLAEDMPAVSPCGLRALCYPEQLVEITVIAVTPETKPKIKTYPCFYVGEKQSFASAVVFGDLVFCSGMTGRLPETGQVRNQSAGVQAIDALDKVKSTLEQAETSLENILRIDYNFVGNLGETLWEGAIMDYFRKHAPALAEDMPAVTRSGLKNLCYPEELVEIAVIAAMPE